MTTLSETEHPYSGLFYELYWAFWIVSVQGTDAIRDVEEHAELAWDVLEPYAEELKNSASAVLGWLHAINQEIEELA